MVLLLGGANLAFAEESGGFVGIGLGGGEIKTDIKAKSGATSATGTFKGGAFAFDVIAGYKQFFTPYLGLRYYANLSIGTGDLEPNTLAKLAFNSDADRKAMLINYGVNVDFLGNFYENETLNFGGFIGIALGGNTWTGKGFDDLQDYLDAQILNGVTGISTDLKKTSFDFALNLGLRTNIFQHHSIELAARVPFLKTKMLDESLSNTNAKIEAHNPYRITVRYAYNF